MSSSNWRNASNSSLLSDFEDHSNNSSSTINNRSASMLVLPTDNLADARSYLRKSSLRKSSSSKKSSEFEYKKQERNGEKRTGVKDEKKKKKKKDSKKSSSRKSSSSSSTKKTSPEELQKQNEAATRIQAMARGYAAWKRMIVPRLQLRLKEIKQSKKQQIYDIKQHLQAQKQRLRQRADEKMRNRQRKESTVDMQSEQIDTIRKENAKIRASNEQLHNNCANLRTNNDRLEETMNNGQEYYQQLELYHVRCLTDNEKLAKFDDSYRQKVEELQLSIEHKTYWAQYEHKVKRAYARALWCAVEMVRDTHDADLLQSVQDLTSMLDGYTSTWTTSPFDDYRPRRARRMSATATAAAEAAPDPYDDVELSPGMIDLVKRNKANISKYGENNNGSPQQSSKRGSLPSKPKVYDSDDDDANNGVIVSKKLGGSSSPVVRRSPKRLQKSKSVRLEKSPGKPKLARSKSARGGSILKNKGEKQPKRLIVDSSSSSDSE